MLEIGPCTSANVRIPAIALGYEPRPDGTPVATVGFPAPQIVRISLDERGGYRRGELFLKSRANTGIVAASYIMANEPFYEFSDGWHPGESGGPVVALADPLVAFSIKQHRREVQMPAGPIPGPYRGRSLASLRDALAGIGIR